MNPSSSRRIRACAFAVLVLMLLAASARFHQGPAASTVAASDPIVGR